MGPVKTNTPDAGSEDLEHLEIKLLRASLEQIEDILADLQEGVSEPSGRGESP